MLSAAMRTWRESSDAGELYGAYGTFSRHGDETMARQCLEKALEYDLEGQVHLECGKVLHGEGRHEEAFMAWATGSEFGNPHCMNKLGDCYFMGEGTEINSEAGTDWKEKATRRLMEQGDIDAAYDMAEAYYRGANGLPRSPGRGAEWEQTARQALRCLPMDTPTAAQRVALMASGCAPTAEIPLGLAVQSCDTQRVRDFELALQAFAQAEASGRMAAPLYLDWGMLYWRVGQMPMAAEKLECGASHNNLHCMDALSEILLQGYGVPRDVARGLEIREATLSRHILRGDYELVYQHALNLLNGENSVPKNTQRARELDAQYNLGLPPERVSIPPGRPQAPPTDGSDVLYTETPNTPQKIGEELDNAIQSAGEKLKSLFRGLHL